MFTFTFDVSVSSGLLTLTLKSPYETEFNQKAPVIGTIGAHQSQQFVFERPGFEDYDLVLLFSSDGKRFPEQNLKQGNSFLLTNAFTQCYILTMQVQIRKGMEFIASSQYMTFAFREAITPGTDPIEPLPDSYILLEDRVTTNEKGISVLQDTIGTLDEALAARLGGRL